MRYYSVAFSKDDGTPVFLKSLNGTPLTSLLQNGLTNPAALNVEFDLPVASITDPNNNCWFRIWGIGLQDIGNAADLNDLNISIFGGMAAGYPLANPKQAGLLIKGKIFQAFGNWIENNQTIDLNIIPGGNAGNATTPANFPFSWKAGTPLATAIQQTYAAASPTSTVKINISPKLVLGFDQVGHYQSAQQFADFIFGLSQSIIGGNYQGVIISTNGNVVNVWDQPGTDANTPTAIAFQDMIGQPVWLNPGEIVVKLVLRADLHISDKITLPPSIGTQNAGSLLRNQDRTTFSGNWQVTQVQHFGNFRQADAASWNTTINAVAIPVPAPTPPTPSVTIENLTFQ